MTREASTIVAVPVVEKDEHLMDISLVVNISTTMVVFLVPFLEFAPPCISSWGEKKLSFVWL
jgi:hypothetical protein